MAKSASKTTAKDEPEEVEQAPAEIAGGSAGNTGQHPMAATDFETEQDKAGLDKSVGGGEKPKAKAKKGAE